MNIALITGSAGLVGSEAVLFLKDKFDLIVGIDDDHRSLFFGLESSNVKNIIRLNTIPNYKHFNIDIRSEQSINNLLKEFGQDIKLIIHTAAQPSHDWASQDPTTDFSINANGTLYLLEATRKHCHDSVFIFTSTNKVYGDTPNRLPIIEEEYRWEVTRQFYSGINESMSIDCTTHSLFGVSKLSADLLVQEYGNYFGMKTGVFRCGCITGPKHSGAKLHGFLSYLVKCIKSNDPYTIIGYKGKQVRDNIHSWDLVNAFWNFYQTPKIGQVYNIGGGRFSNCSVLEAINMCETISGSKLTVNYLEKSRKGDHIWYISDNSKFLNDYPDWGLKYGLKDIFNQLFDESSQA